MGTPLFIGRPRARGETTKVESRYSGIAHVLTCGSGGSCCMQLVETQLMKYMEIQWLSSSMSFLRTTI